MKADMGKLRSSVYGVVDIVYDMENKYVSKSYICKICTKLIFSDVEGGNSKLRQHPCVKNYLHQLNVEIDEEGDEEHDFYCSQILLDTRQKSRLADVLAKLSAITYQRGQLNKETLMELLPRDWKKESWDTFLVDATENLTGAGSSAISSKTKSNHEKSTKNHRHATVSDPSATVSVDPSIVDAPQSEKHVVKPSNKRTKLAANWVESLQTSMESQSDCSSNSKSQKTSKSDIKKMINDKVLKDKKNLRPRI